MTLSGPQSVPAWVPKCLLCLSVASHLQLVTVFPLTVRNIWSTNFIIKLKICKLSHVLRAVWICIKILRFRLLSFGAGQNLHHTYKFFWLFLASKRKDRNCYFLVSPSICFYFGHAHLHIAWETNTSLNNHQLQIEKRDSIKTECFFHDSESVGFISLCHSTVWYFLQQSLKWHPC